MDALVQFFSGIFLLFHIIIEVILRFFYALSDIMDRIMLFLSYIQCRISIIYQVYVVSL